MYIGVAGQYNVIGPTARFSTYLLTCIYSPSTSGGHGNTHLQGDVLDHAGQVKVLRAARLLPGREPARLSVVVVVTQDHLRPNQQDLSTGRLSHHIWLKAKLATQTDIAISQLSD